MPKSLAILSGAMLMAMLAFPALAQTTENGPPKPLEVAPSDTSKPKVKQGDLPQEFIDLREKMKKEFNDWMKENLDVQKQCDASHTVNDRIICDQKQKASQARLDRVHAATRDMLRKIDDWRRKQEGLPPPPWWSEENAKKGDASNGNRDLHPMPPANSTKSSPDAVLLPQSGTTLPANTY